MFTYKDWFLDEHVDLEITEEEFEAFMDGLTFDWEAFEASRRGEELPEQVEDEEEEIADSMLDAYFDAAADAENLYEYNEDLSNGMGFYDYNEIESLIEMLEEVVAEDLEPVDPVLQEPL